MVSLGSSVRLSDWLLAASDDAVASSLALLHELSVFNLARGKVSDLIEKSASMIKYGAWSSETNHFNEIVAARTAEFQRLSRGERLLRMLGELQRLIKIRPRDLRTPQDLSDAAEEIALGAVALLKEDKEAGFTGKDLSALLEYQMMKFFGGVTIPIGDLRAEDERDLIDRVREFVKSRPPEQRQFIMRQLGATEWSDAEIRNAIKAGTIWTAFSAAVHVFGFAFYTAAASLLASLSLHLLPFGFYLGMSTTIAVLVSPWMLVLFAGTGVVLSGRRNRQLSEGMVPLIVTTLCLSRCETEPERLRTVTEEALSLWDAARADRDRKRFVEDAMKAEWEAAQTAVEGTRRELRSANLSKLQGNSERDHVAELFKSQVLTDLASISAGEWGHKLRIPAGFVRGLEAEKRAARLRLDSATGVWEKARARTRFLVENAALTLKLSDATQTLVDAARAPVVNVDARMLGDEATVERLLAGVIGQYPPEAVSLLRRSLTLRAAILRTEEDIRRLEERKRQESSRLAETTVALSEATDARSKSEQRYYGLERV